MGGGGLLGQGLSAVTCGNDRLRCGGSQGRHGGPGGKCYRGSSGNRGFDRDRGWRLLSTVDANFMRIQPGFSRCNSRIGFLIVPCCTDHGAVDVRGGMVVRAENVTAGAVGTKGLTATGAGVCSLPSTPIL